jgi:mono/diheme cytochrome c family protein
MEICKHSCFFRDFTFVSWTIVTLIFLCWQVPREHGPSSESSKSKASESENLVPRGKYLVEGVAMCGTCHTPPGISGEPDRSKWLMGAPVEPKPEHPDPNWPTRAPRLAGTLPGTDAEMITLLTRGVWKTGKPLRPPMPRFQMTRTDAEAVVAYLKSVKPAGPATVPSYRQLLPSGQATE